MEIMTKEIILNLNNGKQIQVLYDENYENTYILNGNVCITITDIKNMLSDTLIHICNSIYDIESIEFINIESLECYYNEMLECINNDYYKEDMEMLKKLFDEYMYSECIEL